MAQDTYKIESQIEVVAAKTPILGMQTASLTTLITEGAVNSYPHKVVWVIDQRTYYYLSSGNGTSINHWSAIDYGGILPYQAKDYRQGVGVIFGGEVFIALAATTASESPANTPAKWLNLSAVKFTKQNFTNTDVVRVVSTYLNPTVQVFNASGEEVSAFISIVNSVVTVDMFPAMTGYLIIKE